jgi:hypothetical protein
VGGSLIFPPTDDVPRGAGRREVSSEVLWEGGGRNPSPEPRLLLLDIETHADAFLLALLGVARYHHAWL